MAVKLSSGDEVLELSEVATMMALSPKSFSNRLSARRPCPPPIDIPGSRRRWLRSTVEKWVVSHEVKPRLSKSRVAD